jgi:hypothetical protein
MWSPALPAQSGLTTSLEFYRREIERRRSLVRRFPGWSFGPMVLTIAAFVVPIVRLQREIDELDEIEKEKF